jgi:hypothetical protein
VSKKSIQALESLRGLRRLHLLGGTALYVTDDLLKHVLRQLPELRHLSLLMHMALSRQVLALVGLWSEGAAAVWHP